MTKKSTDAHASAVRTNTNNSVMPAAVQWHWLSSLCAFVGSLTGWKPVRLKSILPNVHWHYSVQDLSNFDYPQPLGLAQVHLAGAPPINAQNFPLSLGIAPEFPVISHLEPA